MTMGGVLRIEVTLPEESRPIEGVAASILRHAADAIEEGELDGVISSAEEPIGFWRLFDAEPAAR